MQPVKEPDKRLSQEGDHRCNKHPGYHEPEPPDQKANQGDKSKITGILKYLFHLKWVFQDAKVTKNIY
jgi:hypothetical protein